MSKITRKLELVANAAIIIVCLLFVGILAQRYFYSPSNAKAEIPVGKNMKVSDVDFSKAEKTLVLAVSATCHFCSESASFYQKITSEASGANLQIVAALPQSASEGKDYLQKLNVPVSEIKQVSLDEINVSGTPTLILFDREGKVVNYWIGKLSPEKEGEVLAKLKS
jgi:thioredoxin-related protein